MESSKNITPDGTVAHVDPPRRHTQPAHSLGHVDCEACNEVRAMLTCSLSADDTFATAAEKYLKLRSIAATPGAITARYIRKNTEVSYRQYLASLSLFFGGMRMGQIRWFHLKAYQQARVAGDEPFIRKRRPHEEPGPCPAKPKKANQELGLLKHLLQRCNCWTGELAELYEPLLDIDEEIPRALAPEEQNRWLDVSRMSPRWNIVYWYSLLAFGTCMATDEIRGLRLGDINLYQRILSVPRKSSKNRPRTIELVGADVLWAVEHLLQRAKDLGAYEPGHFVFPSRTGPDHWNPESPMSESGIKRQWNEVRQASKLTWFRQYDCRHTAITRKAEAGVPIQVIMSFAGHMSRKMQDHYTHISQSSQRRWLEHAHEYHRPPQPERSHSNIFTMRRN